MSDLCLLYGANGYTGRLIARLAVERGLRPVLAGRNERELAEMAALLGLPYRAFALDDTRALDEAVRAAAVVLHCAGPFSRTYRPMVEACLRAGTHYLDITGEIEVFEALAALAERARATGVMLLPGVGFDVVPSDCLAAHLALRLPSATRLTLAFAAVGGGLSRGTATTMIENLDRGGAIRRDGRITPVPTAWQARQIDFGRGPRLAVTIPWGDVSTAFHTTGIGNVEVYTSVPPSTYRMMRIARHLRWLLGTAPVKTLLKRRVRGGPPGPSDEKRAQALSLLWGEASDDAGGRVESRLSAPEGYTLTARTAVAVVERVLAGAATPGFRTPAGEYGPDFILEFEGVERTDLV